MDENYIENNCIEIKYLRKQLTPEEIEEFEVYLMDHPEMVERLKLEQILSTTLTEVMDRNNITNSNSPSRNEIDDTELQLTIGNMVARWFTIPTPFYVPFVLALCVLALVGLQQFELQKANDLELIGFSTSPLRGSQINHQLDLTSVKGNAAVIVKLKQVDFQYYVLDANGLDDSHIWETEPFQVGVLKDRLILLPKSLNGNVIKINVAGLKDDGSKTDIVFCHYSEVCN